MGTLEAECERQQQYDQTEETHHPKDEQRNYRCDRVFYVTEWLAHLLSSVLNRRFRSPLSSEWFYDRPARPDLAEVMETRSRQTPRKEKRNPSSKIVRITLWTFPVVAAERQ
jgi:hypothetical protein